MRRLVYQKRDILTVLRPRKVGNEAAGMRRVGLIKALDAKPGLYSVSIVLESNRRARELASYAKLLTSAFPTQWTIRQQPSAYGGAGNTRSAP